ncbi:MAG: hypothetical protein KKA79_10150 [Nanoarchaeota archaeon]|nr:hypothetical protein [Nanoarchaeota archaeon]
MTKKISKWYGGVAPQKYIGLENEFTTFAHGKELNFNDNFEKLERDTDYKNTKTSVRSENGNAFYVDIKEVEIVTPPIPLTKGFATRVTDLLMLGRDRLITSVPDYDLTGYSMHWNLTSDETQELGKKEFYEGIAVPFHLFGQTPLSTGITVRKKYKSQNRYELMGDSIINEDQIRATALMAGAYSYAFDYEGNTPFKLPRKKFRIGKKTYNFLPDGRYDKIILQYYPHYNKKRIILPQFQGKIQVQQYLELFYQWIEPYVKVLGTKEEVQNLEDFISGRKELEYDKFKYFAHLLSINAKSHKTFLPVEVDHPKNPGQILRASNKLRKVPLEGILLGEIPKQRKNRMERMSWDIILLNLTDEVLKNGPEFGELEKRSDLKELVKKTTYEAIKGIDKIYEYGKFLNPKLPDLKLSEDLSHIKPGEIKNIIKKKYMEYNLEKDDSTDLLIKTNLPQALLAEVNSKRLWTYHIRRWSIAAAGMFILLTAGAAYYQGVKPILEAERIVKEYQQSQQAIDQLEEPGPENDFRIYPDLK